MSSTTLAPAMLGIAPTTQKRSDYQQLTEKYLKHIQYVDDLAESTCDNRRSALKMFGELSGNPDIRDLALMDIDGYFVKRRESVKASTINIEKQTLRSFFGWCQTRRNIPLQFDYTMIKRSKEKPKKVVSFDSSTISMVVNSCSHEIDALMISVLYETGMRIGELVNLRVDDIRDTEIQVRGKGAKDRVVMMTPDLALALRHHLIKRRISRGYVFQPLQHHINHQNLKFGVSRVRERIKREFRRCGIAMNPHQLRHSFALNWLLNGGNLRSLQKLLGHESLETTQRYLGLTDSHLGEEYSKRMTTSVLTKC